MPKKREPTKWPAGRTIVKVRSLTADELAREYWCEPAGRPVVVLELDDGSILFPSCDAEGNGPGTLFGRARGDQFYVWPHYITAESPTA